MNQVLENRFVENIQRLALGLEIIDAQRDTRVAHSIKVLMEKSPLAMKLPEVSRHNSCLHALRFYRNAPDLLDLSFLVATGRSEKQRLRMPFPIQTDGNGGNPFVDIRLVDSARRYVPRRLRMPIHLAPDAEAQPFTHRVRRPHLFPGAAYDVHSTATGLRGRVLRDNQPLRWVRVEASQPGTNTLIGRAHGDDRGEFLLLIGAGQMPIADLVNPLLVTITVFGPNVLPVPSSPDIPRLDSLWDLPLELASSPGTTDPVSIGETLPANFRTTQLGSQEVQLSIGRINQGETAFIFT